MKASTKRTPQPSPAYHSATQSTRGGQSFVGTPLRLSTLRGTCLIRDRHRCVISRSFDRNLAIKRIKKSGDEARDNDQQLLAGQTFDSLEVAHILPHSLVKTNSEAKLVCPSVSTILQTLTGSPLTGLFARRSSADSEYIRHRYSAFDRGP